MILLKKILLAFFGLCAGGIIAAGVYAFLAIIGIFVRLMGKTGTRKHIMLYETIIILGGVLGNILDIYEFPIYMGAFFGARFPDHSRTFHGDIRGLPGHVPGRDT